MNISRLIKNEKTTLSIIIILIKGTEIKIFRMVYRQCHHIDIIIF
jgi:hypothetical protein